MNIKQELNMTVTSTDQFKELCAILQKDVGESPQTWRFRKLIADGKKNTGKRTRIRKQLADKGKIDLIVEIFTDSIVSQEDVLALRLKY